ncbi:2-succinyl-6-hydroxy-2,4-cyclohexadiene-1-carboxylate synthase [Aetokthonos hydrillicola Thurmond2011]|jgi:2-succinyl-6-hydroxy-2,4-cyclohexadiene-1-carboxylate synthase|uniref:Putative 2-succinyl-6-hydroxy-2,4-cyclohexadiene-1-carboxylate synthase n=1 Tax=Aetokthonos hydrillicola Thurmond2011 TaxID=2712845 RepID=A0AAP5I5G7_9CYAN|nr:2-succinyl-6-hydroxy-2,4-cyclohexadiene-1-carboxylate synthase [Aetokthonos hydrillicola]MBO3457273.1 2-succinyl-6-hydroxy-2,4-cyclohexadiene-1-carboxylate synthase [Aetokthonos hydrillicola CCALA 1050]MBW4586615.1 2-succinyl-6-hydroxy-2,4-cyclohexadiene-1-carboxylate synthase [Aetokthonos hydrillicola CCALA 1050]MDR9894057.1 2-succinyl-6-hydroxy-2,4-cyclohexadiene-1-carboxylate synthase [Aetokthonos hydrillicola Thurmond2011]
MTSGNYRFHYSFNGFSEKPLILFLHGFMGNHHEFDEAIELLSHEFYCLTVDLPGHGKTQVLGGDEYYNMANTASALIKLLDVLSISQCFLVGYSMGGRLALYLTLHFPDRFSKVVLESASPGLLTRVEQVERIKRDEQIARKLVRSDFNTFLLNWYEQAIFGSIKHHPQFHNLIENRLQNNPLELAKSLQFMGTGSQPSLWENLKENKTPLLLLVGEYDEKFIDINTNMTNICKFSQLKLTSNCGHNIHFENTLAFVENIRNFL